MIKPVEFIDELRESADIQYKIFTDGSCFRLFKILKIVFPNAKAYWSGDDGHCITEIDGEFYDIGGKLNTEYVKDQTYAEIPTSLYKAYGLMRYNESTTIGIKTEKYKC